jgi:hypothetical protein
MRKVDPKSPRLKRDWLFITGVPEGAVELLLEES